jgi:hypothetical protein
VVYDEKFYCYISKRYTALPNTKYRLKDSKSAGFKPSCVAEIILHMVREKTISLYINTLVCFYVQVKSAKTQEKGGFQVILQGNFCVLGCFLLHDTIACHPLEKGDPRFTKLKS